jgi:hypothetical protein
MQAQSRGCLDAPLMPPPPRSATHVCVVLWHASQASSAYTAGPHHSLFSLSLPSLFKQDVLSASTDFLRVDGIPVRCGAADCGWIVAYGRSAAGSIGCVRARWSCCAWRLGTTACVPRARTHTCARMQGVFIANQLTTTGTDSPFGVKVGTRLACVHAGGGGA